MFFFSLEFVTPQLESIYCVVSEKFSYNYIQMNVWKTVGIYWMIAVETDVFWSSRGKNINIFLLSSLSIGRCVAQTTSDQQPSFHPTSCLVYLLRGASKCGIYKLYDSKSGNCFPAYCDLKSERGTAWTLVFHGVLVIAGFLLFPISFQVKFPSERKRAKLKSLPHKSGANEITAGSLHPLASNMQLRDSRHRFQRLPQQKLQGFQYRCGIHQHPGTRGYARGRG